MNKRIEISAERPYVLVACYGTLRLGCGNYNHILKGNSEHLGTYTTSPDYTMYGRHSGFPVVGTHGSTAITYDLFKVTDNDTVSRLHSLEGCTGIPEHPRNWYDIRPISTEHGEAFIYVQHGEHASEHGEEITNGDWLNR